MAKSPKRIMGHHFSHEGVRTSYFAPGISTRKMLKAAWQKYVKTIPAYPHTYEGRGIIMCAGGVKYFTCAWITIQLLRKHHCQLPVEVWYIGNELTGDVINALEELDVTCINAMDYGATPDLGVALKPFAMLHSRFREIMFIDADNVPAGDPSYLFDIPEYESTGTVFWPDLWTTDPANAMWDIIDVKPLDVREQESGQLILNKEKCWRELNLCMHFNELRKHYYRFLLGDKDTFRFAWMALGTPFYMVPAPVGICGYRHPESDRFIGLTMIQHDPQWNVLFFHRNLVKWDITRHEERIWAQIRRFRPDAREKAIRISFLRYQHSADGFGITDLEGDVEELEVSDVVGDLEQECIDQLAALRRSPFFAGFLQEVYFQFFKPDYLHIPVSAPVLNA